MEDKNLKGTNVKATENHGKHEGGLKKAEVHGEAGKKAAVKEGHKDVHATAHDNHGKKKSM